ncbi:MAG: lysogenization protein HflD [Pseudomonadales bacterium]
MPAVTEAVDYAALALAGVVQAATLVHRRAHGQTLPEDAHQAVLRSVPTRQAGGMEDVFPDPGAFRLGATSAIDALSGRSDAPEILRYTLQLVELAKMLSGVPQVVEKLGRLIDDLDPDEPDEQQLGRIYAQTVSTLGKRIQVTGDPKLLQQEPVADSVRALLLAGVRMAWLWHQLGGRRWHLILRRAALLQSLRSLTNNPQ